MLLRTRVLPPIKYLSGKTTTIVNVAHPSQIMNISELDHDVKFTRQGRVLISVNGYKLLQTEQLE